MKIAQWIKATIKEHQLNDWMQDYPWLTGSLGDPHSPIWFVGENPSLNQVKKIDGGAVEKTENLQWNASRGDELLRTALTEAGLKRGQPEKNEGWRCYLTNAVKEPEVVEVRNKKKSSSQAYRQKQAEHWWPTLQKQIDFGQPKVLVALGKPAEKIIKHMVGLGLTIPTLERVYHYSYIMMRPESGSGGRPSRGPGHPDRIKEFKHSIQAIADKYAS